MVEITNDSVTATVSAIETLVKDGSDQIANTVTKYGPTVLSTAESYIRVLSAIQLVEYLLPSIILSILAFFTIKATIKNISEYDDFKNDNSGSIIFYGLLSLIISVIIIILTSHITTDMVLGVISPKLELIKMSKDALTQHLVGK